MEDSGARMTENAFVGSKAHKKCKHDPTFTLLPWVYVENNFINQRRIK
jgi:hypothetical protein